MSPAGDEDLRRLFGERRASDDEKAPPFRELLERGRSARARPARIGLAGIGMAAAAMLALAVSLTLVHRGPQPSIRIGEWKAPTDFLLEGSYTDLLDTTPALPEAVPDYSSLLATGKGITP